MNNKMKGNIYGIYFIIGLFWSGVIFALYNEFRKRIDTFDNIPNNLTILHPRNACFDIAERLGIRTFVQLDDDYMSFESRYPEDGKLKVQKVVDLDSIFAAVTRFFWSTNVSAIALAQGGDFIGGVNSGTVFKSPIYRKAMF